MYAVPLCLLVLFASVASAQSYISGVINRYTAVANINVMNCSTEIIVDDASWFQSGDRVLIIQMKGASINSTSTSGTTYGDINSYNDAGNYEFATVNYVAGNSVFLNEALIRTYDPNSLVQLITVPQYSDVIVNGTLTAYGWDGSIGGVLVFEASGTVTQQADIDVSGMGFSGGNPSLNGAPAGTNFPYFASPTTTAGDKGESINMPIAGQEAGLGKQANGGGGGNTVNSGGAGGSSYGTGGNGGNTTANNPYGGVGGAPLSTAILNNEKIFLGGGGGGGQQNNGLSNPGADGGGIVLFKACQIVSEEGFYIRANGNRALDVNPGPSSGYYYIDGAGGGGGAGTVAIGVDNPDMSTVNIEVVGGGGGNAGNWFSLAHGPGGGGSGGSFLTSQSVVVNSLNLAGGNAGITVMNNSPIQTPAPNGNYGATNGTSGGTWNEWKCPEAETCIEDVINDYTAVVEIWTQDCYTYVDVANPSAFKVGDRVLIIQMKGATINSTSTSSTTYGNITAYNDAGNYEFADVYAVSGNTIVLNGLLTRTYTISGLVQLVRVPVYGSAKIINDVNAIAWNGTTGGVVAMESRYRTYFAANIDVDGQGFVGGAVSSNGAPANNGFPYFASPTTYAGDKGESINLLIVGQEAGMGKQANGGGGGNTQNAGGAGGGHYGTGGTGGKTTGNNTYGGVGGAPLATGILTYNKAFLGGGGGGGHQNNNVSTPGVEGGGIVFLKSCFVVGNGQSILGNGNTAADANGSTPHGLGIDGAGGGGAGGQVLLHVDNGNLSSLNIFVNGGDGGDCGNWTSTTSHGPGGGGAAGAVLSNTTLSGVTYGLNGGAAGISRDKTTWAPHALGNWGATAGTAGSSITGWTCPEVEICDACEVPKADGPERSSDAVMTVVETGENGEQVSGTMTQDDDYHIYPNPSTGILNLVSESSVNRDLQIRVYSTSGQLVYQLVQSGSGNISVDLSDVPVGLYVVELSTDNGYLQTERISINR